MAFYTYTFWDAPGRKKKRIKNVLRQATYLLIFAAILIFGGTVSLFSMYVYILLGVMLFFTLLPLFSGKNDLETQATNIANDPENAIVFLPTTVTATPQSIQLQNELNTSIYNWAAFVKKAENTGYYFLFVNALQAIIIPKNAFQNKIDLQTFDTLLSKHLSFDVALKEAIDAGK
ncbi:YcxB family protein [Ferruginibacter yonginensis]|uniref:YcxB family protein n=1 Tax=Ferruginibacter yonginensis TaxID=1310416 RepID=A0ABV8QP62_9BACT